MTYAPTLSSFRLPQSDVGSYPKPTSCCGTTVNDQKERELNVVGEERKKNRRVKLITMIKLIESEEFEARKRSGT